MYKKLATIVGILLILCSATAWAQQKTITQTNAVSQMQAGASTASIYAKASPDLIVASAKIMSAPFSIGSNVLVPLQITIKNAGSVDVTENFFVSAIGGDTDNKAQGYWLGAPDETVEQDSIVVNGLASGAQKAINCYLMLKPLGSQSSQSSGKYWVDVEVDGTSDPDFAGVIAESNENNNVLKITYPPIVPAGEGHMMASSKVPY
ncbi:MAG: CARDB domain-containing protein [Methanotrichaceae archaeon]